MLLLIKNPSEPRKLPEQGLLLLLRRLQLVPVAGKKVPTVAAEVKPKVVLGQGPPGFRLVETGKIPEDRTKEGSESAKIKKVQDGEVSVEVVSKIAALEEKLKLVERKAAVDRALIKVLFSKGGEALEASSTDSTRRSSVARAEVKEPLWQERKLEARESPEARLPRIPQIGRRLPKGLHSMLL